MGYRTVAISSSSTKKALALQLGADSYIDESAEDAVQALLKLGGADMIVSTAPTSESAWKMLGGLAFEGKLVAVSLPADKAPLTPGKSSYLFLLEKKMSLVLCNWILGVANGVLNPFASRFKPEEAIDPWVSRRRRERLQRDDRLFGQEWYQEYCGEVPDG